MSDTAANILDDANAMPIAPGYGGAEPPISRNTGHTASARPRALSRKMYLACTGCIAIVGTWGLWPLGATSKNVGTDQGHSIPASAKSLTSPQPLQLAAFQTPLWVAPIPPPAPPAAPPPPPPLKLQLIAITSGDGHAPGTRGALIFDPDQNKLFTVSVGDRIGSRTILRITEALVELDDASGPRQLSLKTDRSTVGEPPLPSRETPP